MNSKEIFESLQGTGLQQDTFHENMTWDEYLKEYEQCVNEDEKLKQLMSLKKKEDAIEEVTLDKIMSSNFQKAKEIIDQMTIAKRIEILDELAVYRGHLYDAFGRYGKQGIPREEQLSANDFRVLMGRVKHLEILQNWLYGIV